MQPIHARIIASVGGIILSVVIPALLFREDDFEIIDVEPTTETIDEIPTTETVEDDTTTTTPEED